MISKCSFRPGWKHKFPWYEKIAQTVQVWKARMVFKNVFFVVLFGAACATEIAHFTFGIRH